MTCPYCGRQMTEGFIQARGEVYFTEAPHKLLFGASGKDVVLTRHNRTAPTCAAWHCPACKKVLIDYS